MDARFGPRRVLALDLATIAGAAWRPDGVVSIRAVDFRAVARLGTKGAPSNGALLDACLFAISSLAHDIGPTVITVEPHARAREEDEGRMSAVLLFPTISPVPPDVLRDWSGGHRAYVTVHAIRRYVERSPRFGLGDLFDDVTDRDILPVLRSCRIPVDEIRNSLAYFGGVAIRCGGYW